MFSLPKWPCRCVQVTSRVINPVISSCEAPRAPKFCILVPPQKVYLGCCFGYLLEVQGASTGFLHETQGLCWLSCTGPQGRLLAWKHLQDQSWTITTKATLQSRKKDGPCTCTSKRAQNSGAISQNRDYRQYGVHYLGHFGGPDIPSILGMQAIVLGIMEAQAPPDVPLSRAYREG